MLLKRKRSFNTLSSPTSDSSTNTVQSFYPHTKPIPSPLHDSKSAATSFDPSTPSHLNARTRKRHRDNRPDASTIHGACWLGAVIKMSALADVCRVTASTMQRLYDAQRASALSQAEEAQSLQQQQQMQMQQPVPQQTMTQRSTLHSFWRIAQPLPTVQPVQQPVSACSEGLRCEDCDGGLKNEDAMEVDEMSVEDKACGSCRRRICDGCAVWGNERVCQACAGGGRAW
ncbi:hypothetical protein Q7P37_007127 [Cladosporium fusiforme]